MNNFYATVHFHSKRLFPGLTFTDYLVAHTIMVIAHQSKGVCYAKNKYLAFRLDVTERKIRQSIKNLTEMGLVKDLSGGQRSPKRQVTDVVKDLFDHPKYPWESEAYIKYLEENDLYLSIPYDKKALAGVEFAPSESEKSSDSDSVSRKKVPTQSEKSSDSEPRVGKKFRLWTVLKPSELPPDKGFEALKVCPRIRIYIEEEREEEELPHPGELRSFDRATRTEETAPPTKDFVDTKDFVESTENVRTNLRECLAAEISRKKFASLTDGIPGDYDSIVDKWIKYWIEEMGRGKPTSRKGAASSFEKWCEVERDKTPEGADRAIPTAREVAKYMEKKWRWNRKKYKATDRDIENISGRVAQGMTIEEGKMIIDYARFGLNSKDTCSTDYLFGRKFEEVKKGAAAFAAKESGWGKRSVRYYPDND